MIDLRLMDNGEHFSLEKINIYNCDCMDLLKQTPDNYYELSICDPPYGIGRADNKKTVGKNKSRKKSYIKRTDYGNKKWDANIPNEKYFKELIRVSKNQIIWGGNYFTNFLTPTNGYIIWDKVDTIPTYSDGEMAWTSFGGRMTIVPLKHSGFRRGKNIGRESKVIYNVPFSGAMDIHPTQKPIVLYEWLLKNYAKEGDKILDTHLGSGSIAIACDKLGFDLTACEIDEDYYNGAIKRLREHQDQYKLFSKA